MTIEIANYLKFANVQMAAEATGLTSAMTGQALLDAIKLGNNRSSKLTDTQAAEFTNATEGWSVVDHRANTSTG